MIRDPVPVHFPPPLLAMPSFCDRLDIEITMGQRLYLDNEYYFICRANYRCPHNNAKNSLPPFKQSKSFFLKPPEQRQPANNKNGNDKPLVQSNHLGQGNLTKISPSQNCLL